MKQDEFFKIIGILIVSFLIIYFVVKMFKLQATVLEGLTNGTDDSGSNPSSGEAGTASSYADAIKALTVKLQDELLISKYRKDYENVIINLDDLMGYIMLKLVLNLKITDNFTANMMVIDNINNLKTARDSLNSTMTFLDKQ